MASELAKYGLQLPAFSKIGGILASELSVDEAAGRDSVRMGGLSLKPSVASAHLLSSGRAVRLPG